MQDHLLLFLLAEVVIVVEASPGEAWLTLVRNRLVMSVRGNCKPDRASRDSTREWNNKTKKHHAVVTFAEQHYK